MPTHEEAPRFRRDWDHLTRGQQEKFLAALNTFVQGLQARPPEFDPALRVKRVQAWPDVWEMTWAPDGRETFKYGSEVRQGEPHIIWLRIGTHKILP
ncbi:MAG TPA: hypothetical protein VKF14_04215 [Candidatus Dormibacteraeota bacterium]|nr:hypothetical protein [Candidatus Dormibacteraeota bacterium]